MGDLSEHFSRKEFECKCGCGADEVFPGLIDALEELRSRVNEPIIIVSGVRCKAHNLYVGGVPNSAHLRGKAADIRISSSAQRYKFLKAAFGLFRRIGIYRGFIHVDVDDSLPESVCWVKL